MKKTDGKELLFGLNLFSKQKTSLLKILQKWLKASNQLHLVMTPNPEQIIQSRGNSDFKQALQQADLLLPDGVGLVLAARFLAKFDKAQPIVARIAGVEVVADLLAMARQLDAAVLVVGGRDYSPADYFAYKGLKVNWTPGFTNALQPTQKEQQQLQQLIRKLKPAVVFVALGAPTQELWLVENRDLLEKNGVRIAMAVGGSFDYLLGKVPRAPYWWRKLGLEWLFRLLVEPWRWKRQLRILVFLGLIISELIRD